MKRRAAVIAVTVLATALAGCDKPKDESPTAPSATPPPPSAAPPAPSASIPPPPKVGLQLLKFQFTSGVKNKEPEDKLEEAEVDEKVYGHFTLRNRTGSAQKLHVVFRVGGKERTSLDLEVQPSWSYRTWAFNTVRTGDEGKLELVATDETGQVVVEQSLPIKKRAPKKPKP